MPPLNNTEKEIFCCRFMPGGIYLNARELSPKRLAEQINELIEDKELYYEYFRWRGYYSFYNPAQLKGENEYCQFCEVLNDDKKMAKSVTYLNLAEWWNRPPAYRPPVHRSNYTDPQTYNEKYSKSSHFTNKDENEILVVTDDDDPNSELLELETEPSLPRVYKNKITISGSKKKTRTRKSKTKMKITTVQSKSDKSYTKNIKGQKHVHDIHEHDNHEHEEHGALRLKVAGRILEWHDDLPEPTQKAVKSGHAEVRHLNFFFDAPTIATQAYTRRTHYYVPSKRFIVSVDIYLRVPMYY